MGYEYYMNPPNVVKFSTIKADVSNGLVKDVTIYNEEDAEPATFYMDDSAGNVLMMGKRFGGYFVEAGNSRGGWRVLQRLMQHFKFKVKISGIEPDENGEDFVLEASDFNGWGNISGDGVNNAVPVGFMDAFKNGVGRSQFGKGVEDVSMARNILGTWGRQYKRKKRTGAKVSKLR